VNTLLKIFALFLVAGCSEQTNEKNLSPSQETSNQIEENVEPPEVNYYSYSDVTFEQSYSDSVTHFFSDTNDLNKFKIFIPKGKITETNSFLIITNQIDDTLHFEMFETWNIIYGYALAEITSDAEVISHMKQRVSKNLNETSFVNISETDISSITDSKPEDFEIELSSLS